MCVMRHNVTICVLRSRWRRLEQKRGQRSKIWNREALAVGVGSSQGIGTGDVRTAG
eukprot:COSAG01_NODE_38619_length_487_cov_1.048969_1_plen_55_part_10